ncbi:MAG: CRISPR-associated endoribonuclease Cas6 [Brevinematia bacterium]
MRLKIRFTGEKESLILPIHHNEILQGVIYKHLDTEFADFLHNKGLKDPESGKYFKLFTFSRLLPKKAHLNRHKNTIEFFFPITWIISSPLPEFVVSLYNNLIREKVVELSHKNSVSKMYVSNVWIDSITSYKNPVLVRTLSPIVVYTTKNEGGKLYTYYYSPFDSEFSDLLISNLIKKFRALKDKNFVTDEKMYIRPIEIANSESIIYFKGTVIKGWSGIFEMALPNELFYLAFSCGLGAKNSQGFGCIEIWRSKL